jgi:hypothetical protein
MADSEYMKAINAYCEALRNAWNIAHDPFQPPEVIVEDSRNLLSAIWNLQVEYAALVKK